MFGIFIGKGGEPGSGGGLALVANMGMAASYTSHNNNIANPTTSTCRISILRDGTWTITAEGSASDAITVGTPVSGNWGSPNQAFAGDDYEVTFDGTTWQRITTTRTFQVTVNDTTLNDGQVTNSQGVTVTVRKFGTTSPTSTDTVTLNAEANRTDV